MILTNILKYIKKSVSELIKPLHGNITIILIRTKRTTLFQFFSPLSPNRLNGLIRPASKKDDIPYQNPINWVETERVF